MDQHFVIVGGGAAGQAAIDSLIQSNFGGKITMISNEKYPPYARVALSKGFNTKASDVLLKDENFYEQNNIQLLLNSEVVKVDSERVILKDGKTISFDKLLLATGSNSKKWTLDDGTPGIYTLRTVEDLERIQNYTSKYPP